MNTVMRAATIGELLRAHAAAVDMTNECCDSDVESISAHVDSILRTATAMPSHTLMDMACKLLIVARGMREGPICDIGLALLQSCFADAARLAAA